MADFKLGFSLDTSGLEKGKKALQDVAAASDHIASSEGKRKQAHDSADAALNKTIAASKQAEASAQRYIQSIKMEEQALKAFENGQKTLNAALEQGKLNAQQHARYIKQMGDAYQEAKRDAEAFRSAQPQGPGAGSGFASALERIRGLGSEAGNLGGMLSGNAGLGGAMEGVAGMATRLGAALGPVGVAIASVGAAAVATGVAFKMLILPLAEVQDKFAGYKGQIDLVLKSQGQTDEMFNRIVQSANAAGVSIDTAATAFTRILRNAEDIGASADQVAQLTETVQKLGIISRTGQGEMQGAMIQLSQALAAGRLNGDELRSIMENMPALAKAIADGLGVSVGQLRRMGAEGELTSAKVFEALLGQQDKVNKEFEKMPQTTAQAFARMGNQADLLKNKIAETFDATGIAQSVINYSASLLEGMYNLLDETQAERLESLNKQIEQRSRVIGTVYNPTLRAQMQAQLDILIKERDAINGAAEAEKKRKEAQAGTDAANSRDAGIRQAVEAIKAAGYDKEKQETKRLQQENENYKKKLEEAQQAREELRKKNIDAAQAEITAFLAVQKAILAVQQAMQSGKPADVWAAYANYNKAQGALSKAQQDKKSSDDELSAAGENIRIIEQGIKGTFEDLKKVGKGGPKSGGSKSESALSRLRKTVGDLERAIGTGAMGAEVGFLTQSYAAEREAKGSGAETRLLLEKQVALQQQQNIANMERQTKQQDELTAATGKSRAEIREIEIAQKAYNYQIETFGTSTSPAAKKAVEAYTAALRRQIEAADRAAAAQKVLNAEQQASLSTALLNGPSDQRSQDRIRFEADLQNQLKGIADPAQKKAYEDARRKDFANQQAMQEKKVTEELKEQARMQADELRLSILSTRELEVQRALLAKKNELRGVDPNSQFYKDTMGETERLVRQGQSNGDVIARNRRIITGFEQAADEVSGLFGKAFDDAFEYGLKGAGNNFLKGMGSIFRKMGNDLVYEIAVRPIQALLTNLAQVAAQRLIASILGGGGAPQASLMSSASATIAANPGIFAAGGLFGPQGYRAFAGGGAFTNSIVTSPTLFAFAGGTGLMGEAGPEAIIPLKRGANGKLGVEGGGGGGDVTVVVNDMRSSPQSQPVETSEKRGPDGRRMISVMIRDEVRRQIRSGDLDREMNSSYGAVRTIARK